MTIRRLPTVLHHPVKRRRRVSVLYRREHQRRHLRHLLLDQAFLDDGVPLLWQCPNLLHRLSLLILLLMVRLKI